jgi:hypothetical protein
VAALAWPALDNTCRPPGSGRSRHGNTYASADEEIFPACKQVLVVVESIHHMRTACTVCPVVMPCWIGVMAARHTSDKAEMTSFNTFASYPAPMVLCAS